MREPADFRRSTVASCRCGAEWSAVFGAHCGQCHRTFGSVDGYEAHQPEGVCVEPESAGLTLDLGYWCRPGEASPNSAAIRGVPDGVQGTLFD